MQPTSTSNSPLSTTPEDKKGLGAPFRRLFAVVSMTGMGDGVTFNALPWLATSLTGSAFLVSLVSMATRLPWLFFSLPFGVLIDRVSRPRLLLVASIVRALMIAIIALAVWGNRVSLPLLIGATFLFGTAKVLFDSTSQTIVPTLVQPSQLEKANGLFSTAQLITSDILGGALSGLLLTVGMPIPFFLDALTSTLSVPLLLGLPSHANPPAKKAGFRADLLEGLHFVWKHPLLRSLAFFSIGMTGTFSAVVATQIFFMREILHLNSWGFGLLISVATLGSIAGGQCVAKFKQTLGPRKSILLAIAVMSIGYGLTGLSSHWLAVGALYTICSFFIVIWSVQNVTFRQRAVPNELLGRVNGVFRFLSWGISSLGALLGGGLISVGELFYSRDWAIRSPYLLLFAVYAVLFFLARRLFSEDRLMEI